MQPLKYVCEENKISEYIFIVMLIVSFSYLCDPWLNSIYIEGKTFSRLRIKSIKKEFCQKDCLIDFMQLEIVDLFRII